MKSAIALGLGLALLPALACAHTSMAESRAVSGKAFKAVLAVPHGCDGAATVEVHVRLPEGFVGAKPMPKPGWTLAIIEAPYAAAYELHGESVSNGPVEIRWLGGRLEDAWYDEFVVRGTFADFPAERRVAFPVTQICEGGASVAWDEVAPAGVDAHSLEHPAPIVTVSSEAVEHEHSGHDTGTTGGVAKTEAGTDGHGELGSAVAGPIEVSAGFARAMLPNQKVGGAYLTIANTGTSPDRLLSAASEAAGSVDIHEMEMKGDVMTMRPFDGPLDIPAGGTVELKPGSTHLMFTDVATPFKQGDTVKLTLIFERAGAVELTLPVAAVGAKGADHSGHAMPGMKP
ncbi:MULTISPECIES: DUF1775 domain-containing protein [unclassified Aureimonas]|uniref:DUF1775 domain-containing protein n=1 Tax=unclassified Aureimonas TaxID=2615206 RepID=UPI0006F2D420|nr:MULTISPECIES: DUF1775 domain-containing protein [unclassified Aureimonas]KQT54014.1 hypothetical protein ASG62_12385 [Aureimonas sp. Leaf427]KQT71546.1 hypothetical protein ASG54_18775 [Aureimonas sp. Leaf460]